MHVRPRAPRRALARPSAPHGRSARPAAAQESKRVAELLAQLPRELDVEGLVVQAMGGDASSLLPSKMSRTATTKRSHSSKLPPAGGSRSGA